jgi:hypothetical protein
VPPCRSAYSLRHPTLPRRLLVVPALLAVSLSLLAAPAALGIWVGSALIMLGKLILLAALRHRWDCLPCRSSSLLGRLAGAAPNQAGVALPARRAGGCPSYSSHRGAPSACPQPRGLRTPSILLHRHRHVVRPLAAIALTASGPPLPRYPAPSIASASTSLHHHRTW